jgi:transposase InsO family protein
LGLSRASIYKEGIQTTKDEIQSQSILKVLQEHPSYGHRGVAIWLGIGKKRVRRVMKPYSIKPYKRKARWTKRRDRNKPYASYPNLVKGVCPIKPNIIFAGDFTRLYWNKQVFYLATFIDLYTREVVGWSISTRHTSRLVVEALMDAATNKGLPAIVHTDQGSEYTSEEYTSLLTKLNIKISMSAKSSPWVNAYQESFYNNFKTDLGLEFERFQTIGRLVEAMHHTICYYNQHQIHTALKMPPTKFRMAQQT